MGFRGGGLRLWSFGKVSDDKASLLCGDYAVETQMTAVSVTLAFGGVAGPDHELAEHGFNCGLLRARYQSWQMSNTEHSVPALIVPLVTT